ncbi:MAG: acyl-CoA/acyl-ACP dehydrogenase [Novosphingobium sp.]|nr:acyl-CoA/acyl-ACP dehydrogenase [Novosphingobium sp.]
MNDEQEAIAREARRILDDRVDQARLMALIEQSGAHDESFWTIAVEQGWTGIGIDEDHGGIGLGLIELGLVAQATGAATAGAPFLTGNSGAAHDLQAAGSDALKAQWLEKLVSGEATACCAFAEASSPLPSTPNVQFADGKLSGTKPSVAGGLKADFAIVLARSEAGEDVLALCDLASNSRTPFESFDNSRLYADLEFSQSPAEVFAQGKAARTLALAALTRMALVTAWEQLGGAEALLFIAREYANTRKAFGQPIGAFQSVKHRIAELYGLVEITRANCIHASSREGEADFLRAAAAARLSATEAYDTAARDTVQIHGGIGVTWESGLHLHMRRARSLAIEQGNMLFWEDILTDELASA